MCVSVLIGPGALIRAENSAPASVFPRGNASDERLAEALEDFIPNVLEHCASPGLIVTVARYGDVIYSDTFGFADLKEQTPMSADAAFKGGSMGKVYVAIAVMQLVEQGRLQLDAPVNDYLKTFQVINPLGERGITVRDLLTHRSGLASNPAGGAHLNAPQALAEHLRDAFAADRNEAYYGTWMPRFSARVGEKYQYSNLGIATLGYLVELTNPEQVDLSTYIETHIMQPLGMSSSQYPAVQDQEHIRADLYARIPKGYTGYRAFHVEGPALFAPEFPAGNGIHTADEHIRLLLAFMQGGEYQGHRILQKESVDAMLEPHSARDDDEHVGLVWWLRNIGEDTFSFGHPGGIVFEWSNNFRAFPNLDVAYVVATNQWPMAGTRYKEAELIELFIIGWLQEERELGRPPEFRPWAWKTSYVAGLMFGDALGFLALDETLPVDTVEEMLDGAEYPGRFDESGFRAGLQTIQSAPRDVEVIRALIEEGDQFVNEYERRIITTLLGN